MREKFKSILKEHGIYGEDIEEIYNKYGLDVTNCVRENAGYNI